jgi:hypothetical protein
MVVSWTQDDHCSPAAVAGLMMAETYGVQLTATVGMKIGLVSVSSLLCLHTIDHYVIPAVTNT